MNTSPDSSRSSADKCGEAPPLDTLVDASGTVAADDSAATVTAPDALNGIAFIDSAARADGEGASAAVPGLDAAANGCA